SIIQVVQNLGMEAGVPSEQITKMIGRASMSVAYGESLSNLLQPFYLLVVFPVMGLGVKLQARDVIGYLVIPFLLFLFLQSLFVLFIPL
ncbi:MAG: TIGR00366 family protein, partial [Maribacter sp.]